MLLIIICLYMFNGGWGGSDARESYALVARLLIILIRLILQASRMNYVSSKGEPSASNSFAWVSFSLLLAYRVKSGSSFFTRSLTCL